MKQRVGIVMKKGAKTMIHRDSVIYSKTILTCKESEDGETPTQVVLTEEKNCYIIWLEGFNYSNHVLEVCSFFYKDRAIEKAVKHGERLASDFEHEKPTPIPLG
jgi:hypothetical protein